MNKSRIEKVIIQSKSLNKEMSMLVYLPGGYDEGETFPTLYFMHGRSGNENFITHIDLNVVSDRLIEANRIRPMIIVCPNMDNRSEEHTSELQSPDHLV